jgi:non-reducing end alpha-L-arabinofuranosidase
MISLVSISSTHATAQANEGVAMNKFRSVIPVYFAVSVVAVSFGAACWSFSSNPDDPAGDESTSGMLQGGPMPSNAAAPRSTDVAVPAAPAAPGGNTEGANPNLPVAPSGMPSNGTPTTNIAPPAMTGTPMMPGQMPQMPEAPPAIVTPCDILSAAGNPCVAAHSTVRVVYGGYDGPLYQVCRGASAPGPNSCPGGNTRDIGIVDGMYADAAAQDAFCMGGACTISIIYDQSPSGNDLKPAPRGGFKPTPDDPAVATDLPITLNGHKVYGIFSKPGMGYRAGCTGCGTPVPIGTAVGDEPETEYMVTSQNGLVNGCCFNYGNAETTSNDDGNGTMEAVYFGGGVVWGTGSPGGHNNGPWVMADLENGLYAGWERGQDQAISTNTPLRFNFVTGVVIGDTADKNGGRGRFAIYGGNAQAGNLQVMYDGIRPEKPGYVPMQKQGSIILGIGGDNSGSAGGQWFEGVMASGAGTLATANQIQANIVAAGYGK